VREPAIDSGLIEGIGEDDGDGKAIRFRMEKKGTRNFN
jgi:hypothetical protein